MLEEVWAELVPCKFAAKLPCADEAPTNDLQKQGKPLQFHEHGNKTYAKQLANNNHLEKKLHLLSH
jgi:hypothetical protein